MTQPGLRQPGLASPNQPIYAGGMENGDAGFAQVAVPAFEDFGTLIIQGPMTKEQGYEAARSGFEPTDGLAVFENYAPILAEARAKLAQQAAEEAAEAKKAAVTVTEVLADDTAEFIAIKETGVAGVVWERRKGIRPRREESLARAAARRAERENRRKLRKEARARGEKVVRRTPKTKAKANNTPQFARTTTRQALDTVVGYFNAGQDSGIEGQII